MKNLLIILGLISITLNIICARVIIEYKELNRYLKRKITYLLNDTKRKVNDNE